ncbi:unnamed protein product [Laminaria digitata]
MSIAEQRLPIRGLSMNGLLPQLEKVTLGDGTTSYVKSPGRGPGRDLFAYQVSVVFKELMPWATVRVLDSDSRKNTMARHPLAAQAARGGGQFFDTDDDDQERVGPAPSL